MYKKAFYFSLLLTQSAGACGAITAQPMAEVRNYAHSYGLDERLMAALIWTESRFCHYEPGTHDIRTSNVGALGYGQLMPATAQELGVDPRNPSENIKGSAAYLRKMWDTFKDWNLALAAYNAGPRNVMRAGGIPSQGASDYVYHVLSTYAYLKTVSMP